MSVILRQRLKGKKISVYLEVNWNGKRKYEYPRLYLYPDPEKGKLTPDQKEHNRKVLAIAEKIRHERFWECENGKYGLVDKTKIKASFISFMEILAAQYENVPGTFGNWNSSIAHLRVFDPTATFESLNKEWVENWKNYLLTKAKQKTGKPLGPNTRKSYYDKVVAAINTAHKQGIISSNPTYQVDALRETETEVEFLTLDELRKAAKTECENLELKRAFLFSALTGLRWSDVTKLTWGEIQHSEELGYFIRYRTKKTKKYSTLNISKQARELLGEMVDPDYQIFSNLKYSSWNNLKLREWMLKAGITKKITFHCARHTFATGQVTVGTDLYVIKEAMALKSIKTVERYAKVISDLKKEAMNKIQIEL